MGWTVSSDTYNSGDLMADFRVLGGLLDAF